MVAEKLPVGMIALSGPSVRHLERLARAWDVSDSDALELALAWCVIAVAERNGAETLALPPRPR